MDEGVWGELSKDVDYKRIKRYLQFPVAARRTVGFLEGSGKMARFRPGPGSSDGIIYSRNGGGRDADAAYSPSKPGSDQL